MNANELMIDDWVLFSGEPKRVRSIVVSDNRVERIYVFGKSCQVSTTEAYIQPIPLTQKILEKNGFERCVSSTARTSTAIILIYDSNQFCHKNLGNLRIIDKRPCYGWTLRTDIFGDTCHNEIHHINYVHELQHALRLCGIDKTIEL